MRIVLTVCFVVIVAGCGGYNVGAMPQSTSTAVELSKSNYKLVKPGATGVSKGFNLLGVIALSKPTYANAKANLYASTTERLEGRSIALVNQTQDVGLDHYVLFSIPKITITADIIEFKDETPASPEGSSTPMGEHRVNAPSR